MNTGTTDVTDCDRMPAQGAARPDGQQFLRWAIGIYVVATASLGALTVRSLRGKWVYPLDDPMIHLTVARNLAFHGTWGVVPGHYESASSSPLWTALLGLLLLPFGHSVEVLPLAMNVLLALILLWLVSVWNPPLRPALARPLHVAATAVLVIFIMFLPALSLLGMEHTLHAVLLVGAVTTLMPTPRRESTRRRSTLLGIVLIVAATLTRFETVFVAIGMATGWLLCELATPNAPSMRSQAGSSIRVRLRRSGFGVPLLLLAAPASTVAAYALLNRLLGGGFLPNSVLAKSKTARGASGIVNVGSLLDSVFSDPLLPLLWLAATLWLIVGDRSRRRETVLAGSLALGIPLQAAFARVGTYERYQAYLIVLGVLFVFAVLSALSGEGTGRASTSPGRLLCALILLLVPFMQHKVSLTAYLPKASQDIARQQRLAGVFLAKYYDRRGVATGQLGYISLIHDGALVDLNGLGDYAVLKARVSGAPLAPFLARRVIEQQVAVVAEYPGTLGADVPSDWVFVGEWRTTSRIYSAVDTRFQFWATTPEEVGPLAQHLTEFASELPSDETLHLDPLAAFRAAALLRHEG